MNEDISNNTSTNDDKNEINSNSEIDNENKEIKIKNNAAINEITQILSKHKKNKEKEDFVSEEIVKYIKENNININEIKDEDDSTIIQKYCREGEDYYLKCMLLCLEKLMDENKLNQYLLNENTTKMNIFEISCEMGEIKIFRILQKYLKGNQFILNHLINDNNDGKTTIFHIAADKNKIISLLFFYSFYYNNISCLNIKNKSTWTPLHIACYKGNYEFVQYLVNLEVDINSKDNENKTPLFYTIQSHSSKIIKYLILSGANKKIKDNRNKMAIEYSNDKIINDILEDKSIFDIAFKCQTQYKSLKNHHRNIYMLLLLIFMIFFHLFLIIKYKSSNFLQKCYQEKNFSLEFSLLILNIIFQICGILIYIFFQYTKKARNTKNNNNNNKFCIRENGIEYYEMFKYNENICVKCQRVKEMNTKHCIACDVCIECFDHHCFFLNACIYYKNKKYFKIFLYEILITVFLNLFTSLIFFIDIIKYPKIYYGIITNDIEIKKNGFYDFIIYLLDILYLCLALFFILASIIPYIFDFIYRKKILSKSKVENTSNDKAKALLIPME